MAYDPKLGSLVLFGGALITTKYTPYGSYVFPNDTWTYRGGVWTNISAKVGAHPPGRWAASFTYDAKDGVLILAGGFGYYANSPSACARLCDDMWSFNGTRWTSIALPAAYPTLLSGGGYLMAAYDSTDGYVVTTDHVDSNHLVPTYSYAGGVWSNLSTYAPFTTESALIDDPANQGVLLYGGYTERAANQSGTVLDSETWMFHAGHWNNITGNLTTNPPTVQSPPAVTWDNATHSVLLAAVSSTNVPVPHFGGMSTWEFNGTWTNVTSGLQPAIAGAGALAWDAADLSSVLFGGTGSETFPYDTGNATWLYTSSPPIKALQVSASPNPVDVGAPTVLSPTFANGTPPYQYAWAFGDGGSSSNGSPSHMFAAAGTYTITLNLTDHAGHAASAAVTLLVVPAPTSHPSAAENPTDAGLATGFQANVVGGAGGGSIAWQFGDGGTGMGPTPTHLYGAAGNYSVHVWVNDSGGTRLSTTFVEVVHSALAVSISASPGSPELGELVNFSATATGGTTPYSYSWTFGDGGTGGNLRNISHVFTTNGPFAAKVLVGDGAGGTVAAVENLSVTLNLTVLANWHFGAAPLAVSFESTVRGGVPSYTYRWSFGDGGTSTAPSPVHTYGAPGFYTAIVSVADQSGQIVHGDWSVLVAQGGGALNAVVTIAPATIVIGGATTVTATIEGGVGGYALSWSAPGLSCGDVILLTEQCSASTPGSYTVQLELTDASGATTSGSAALQVTASSTATKPPGVNAGFLSELSSPLLWGGLGALLAVAGILGARYVLGRPISPAISRTDSRYAAFDATDGALGAEGAPADAERPPGTADRPPDREDDEFGDDALEDLL